MALPLASSGAFETFRSEEIESSPLVFASSFLKIRHRKSKDCKGAAVLENSGHSSRVFCDCMDSWTMDKQFVLELAARDQIVNAFEAIVDLCEKYSPSLITEDEELVIVISRYDFLATAIDKINETSTSRNYELLSVKESNLELGKKFEKLGRNHYLSDFIVTPPSSQKRSSSSAGEWRHMFTGDYGCNVWMQMTKAFPTRIGFRLDGLVNSPVEALLSVASEVSMTTTWAPYFKFPLKCGLQSAESILSVNRMDKVSIYRVDLPFPLSNREACVHGWLTDDLEKNKRMVICMRSLDKKFPVRRSLLPMDVLPETPHYTRINMEGCCVFTLISPTQVYIQNLWFLDMKASVPQTLASFVARNFIKSAFVKFRDICEKAATDAAWRQLREANKWLYLYMGKRKEELKFFEINCYVEFFELTSASSVKQSRFRRLRSK